MLKITEMIYRRPTMIYVRFEREIVPGGVMADSKICYSLGEAEQFVQGHDTSGMRKLLHHNCKAAILPKGFEREAL